MSDLTLVVRHLLCNVLPAAESYRNAEAALTERFSLHANNAAEYAEQGRTAIREASNVAIAIDGLTDRMHNATLWSKIQIRSDVQGKCMIRNAVREGCLERIRGVAVVYKHEIARDQSLLVRSDKDVLAVGAGYGVDAFGVGKMSGVEVLVEEVGNVKRKFLADVPAAARGWTEYLKECGAQLPEQLHTVCGIELII